MKLKADFTIDKNINSNQITSFNDFLNTFASINYRINNTWFSKNISTQSILPKVSTDRSNYYIEVPNDVKQASEINLTFNVRGNTYKYILK